MVNNIFVVENHDEVLRIWKDAVITDAILIHVDAHFDCERLVDERINIGNFISHAIKLGIVARIIWVIPASVMKQSCCIRELRINIEDLCDQIIMEEGILTCHTKQNPSVGVVVCDISKLNEVIESDYHTRHIFMDVDMDFFFISHICVRHTCIFNKYKSDSIKCFYQQINLIIDQCSIVTICKSVIGGYTPLRFDYTAEYLKRLILKIDVTEIAEFNQLIADFKGDSQTIKTILNFLHSDELIVSAKCFLMEVKIIESDNFPPKLIRYVSNIQQTLLLGIPSLIKKKMPIAHHLNSPIINLQMATALRKKLKTDHYECEAKYNDELCYLLARYYFYMQKYTEALFYLQIIKNKVEKSKNISYWEEVITSYPETYKLTPARLEILKMIAFSNYHLNHIREAYLSARYLQLINANDRENKLFIDVCRCKMKNKGIQVLRASLILFIFQLNRRIKRWLYTISFRLFIFQEKWT